MLVGKSSSINKENGQTMAAVGRLSFLKQQLDAISVAKGIVKHFEVAPQKKNRGMKLTSRERERETPRQRKRDDVYDEDGSRLWSMSSNLVHKHK
ncbi:hypothetical protein OUZ56_025064 [Daphnia magna]|uniref:Uncharacterized protein n=1 Tax=Daphnia magna TaxID=35525 RepID=A0ABQ9ZIR1_9CRUS|nr:hypothetical protein OUZ56_025064 [Daphnia magna]